MQERALKNGLRGLGVGTVLCLLTVKAVGAPWFAVAGGDAVAALDRAHEAFLARDYASVSSGVRDALADTGTDTIVRKNALDLLAKADDETRGNLPVDWTLPAGVSDMKFTQSLKQEPDGYIYKVQIRADIVERDMVQQVQVARFPDVVILDRQAGMGEFSTGPEDVGFSFDLEREMSEALADGLYLLRLELKDGTRSEGWFIISDLAATTTPRLDAPAVGQTFDHGRPEFVFEDFRSAAYKSYERRRLHINAARLTSSDPGWDLSWGFYLVDPAITSVTVGPHPNALGVEELPPGRYWVSVEFLEERRFGPMKLRRGAKTGRPIYVRTP